MQAKEPPTSQQLSTDPETPLGLYLHIPFCASTCDFCAFYQKKPHRPDIDRYLAGMHKEMQLKSTSRPLKTIFWGGGTPGLLPAKDLYQLGAWIRQHFDCSQLAEWTVEMAPSTVKPDKVKALAEIGVTRISMGVQSFNPLLLEQLGRLHSPSQTFKAYDILRSGSIPNINLDLIFAIPNQTLEQLTEDFTQTTQLKPEHISTYCLTFEEDTALYIKLSQGKVKRDPEKEIVMYEKSWELLENAGYGQYEISNFARAAYGCLHNINTWHMYEWLGIGPSASSQFENRRFTNAHSIDEWIKGLERDLHNNLTLIDVVNLTPSILLGDCMVFGLRMNQGVDLHKLSKRFPTENLSCLNALWNNWAEESLIEFLDNRYVRLTLKGRLVADRIGIEILMALEEANS